MAINELRLHQQTPSGGFRFYDRINQLLSTPSLKIVRIASAYARWDGLGLISDRLEAFLRDGGNVEFLLGFDNGVTSPDCFLYGLYLSEIFGSRVYCGAMIDEFDNSIFHQKTYQFWSDESATLLVGSPNLTAAGISRNTELGLEVQLGRQSDVAAEVLRSWSEIKNYSRAANIDFVRAAKAEGRLSGEEETEAGARRHKSGKLLDVGAKVAPKPVFTKFLEIQEPRKRDAALRKLDPASQKPKRLYLQVLENETGGTASGGPGYQIQLPVATLSAFFGVGPAQSQQVCFHFGSDEIHVSLTHFENNTHRVRLRPLRDVHRPAIVVFERRTSDQYDCHLVPRKDYGEVLREKCTQQTRVGARRWGIE
jgi:HKD family nuclease